MIVRFLLAIGLGLLVFGFQASTQAADQAVNWRPWSAASFELAKRQKKPVFLYLEAVWCHWCHVMQQTTLVDARVVDQLNKDFIAIRVDHDAMPGLANRYRDHGWPALIWLGADGTDLVKRAGYQSPEAFSRLLNAIVADPTPEQAVSPRSITTAKAHLSKPARDYLLRRHEQSFDSRLGGLNTPQKFVDRDSMEFSLRHLDQPSESEKLNLTLDAAQALIDPAWGGVYQYSTGGRWDRPHYEKIMRVQAGYLRVYSMAYAALEKPSYLSAAKSITAYLLTWLKSPDGGFYSSQDADLEPGKKAHDYFALGDAQRRAIGIPKVDKHRYADANAMAIEALAVFAMVSGDAQARQAAVEAFEWVTQNRRGTRGLMRHAASTDRTSHLADSLLMARAGLRLYELTAEPAYLTKTVELAGAVDQLFRIDEGGFMSSEPVPGVPLPPKADLAENIVAARFFNRLAQYSGDQRHRLAAEQAMKFLSAHAQTQRDFQEIGILLAEQELRADAPHLTVVGAKQEPAALALFQAALQSVPLSYRRIEWWDPEQGPLPNHDVAFPELERAAGFVCAQGRCSRPSTTVEAYQRQIKRLVGSQGRLTQ